MGIDTLIRKHLPARKTWLVVVIVIAAAMIADYFIAKLDEKERKEREGNAHEPKL